MHVACVCGRVTIRDLLDLLPTDLSKLVERTILSNCLKISIDHGVGISLSALNPETTVEESSVY
jgi:hypothetical protein